MPGTPELRNVAGMRDEPESVPATIVSRPDFYIQTLDVRAQIGGEAYIKELIPELLELHDGLEVLDVGCGTGADALRMAELVAPRGRVVGLDHSPEMIAEARQRARGSDCPIEFVPGSASAIDFPDDSFDRCRCDRVLSHIADPMPVVRELARVVRPGGLVLASDLDVGTMFVNSSDRELASRLASGLADSVANGWSGRNLQHQLHDAGLRDIVCVPTVILNGVAFMRMVFAYTLGQMLDAGETTPEQVAEFWDDLEQGEREGWLCSGVTAFTVVGRKPS
jgi:ubiquinone/menaquinone biosynthesis C-methylase UbiE